MAYSQERETKKLENVVKAGAQVVCFVSAVSIFNSWNAYRGSSFRFLEIASLNLVPVMFEQARPAFLPTDLHGFVAVLSTSLILCLLATFGSRRRLWAVQAIVGLYVVDTALSAITRNFYALALHLFFLWGFIKAIRAASDLKRLDEGQGAASELPQYRSLYDSKLLFRIRTLLPYPLFVGAITYVLGIPVITLRLYPMDDVTFPVFTVLVSAIWPAAIVTTLFGSLYLMGILSGYKPFSFRWKDLTEDQARSLLNRLQGISRELEFETFWENAGSAFIAVRAPEVDMGVTAKGATAPLRFSFSVSSEPDKKFTARLVIEGHALVLWDSGEGAQCKKAGELILQSLSAAAA